MSIPDVIPVLKRKCLDFATLEGKAHSYVSDLVSIVITNYNKQPYLVDSIRSVFYQTYRKGIELIIVDDCSTDDSHNKIIELLAGIEDFKQNNKEQTKVLYHALPRRLGTAWAQNIGYYLAQGEYICNLDADDMMENDKIEKQVAFLKEHNLDAVGTGYNLFEEQPGDCTSRGDPSSWLGEGVETIRALYEKNQHKVCWGTVLMKSSVIDLIGGNNKLYIGTEDFEVLKRMTVTYNLRVDNIKRPLYWYRKCSSQRSKLFLSTIK